MTNIFNELCPHCHHRADEHLVGDFEAGICFICQRNGLDKCHNYCGFCRGKCKGKHYISPSTEGQ